MAWLIRRCLIVSFLFFSVNLWAQSSTFYVDPASGNDLNIGSIEAPFKTINKGISAFTSSGTIYLRGGTYLLSATVRPTLSGSASGYFNLWAYPGELPILDFSTQPFGNSSRGLNIAVNYWYIKGLEIKNAGDNGIYITGGFNIVENCAIHDNKDTGLQISGGGHDNRIINCDSYYNSDLEQDDADGFAPKLDVGSNNYFYGCRAWQNSDDGWDGYLDTAIDVTTVLENCWCFKNGYLKDGSASSGNGNGFKMGGSTGQNLAHNFILKNCLVFDNRVKGFDQNHNRGSMTLYNCSALNNGSYNFSINETLNEGKILTIKNSISLGSSGVRLLSTVIEQCNTWSAGFSVSGADFKSINTAAAYGPRKSDGSLPEIDLMHLQSGSKLIDAGVDVGIPYLGLAPDLGAFEFVPGPTNVESSIYIPNKFLLLQNYPNPFNPETTIQYLIPASGLVDIKIYDINGRVVNELFNGFNEAGIHEINWKGINQVGSRVSSGNYFCVVNFKNQFRSLKLILLK